jgi:hypothetical protein
VVLDECGVDVGAVYTAMHGVGAEWTARAIQSFGLPPCIPVTEQNTPDATFPTVAFPVRALPLPWLAPCKCNAVHNSLCVYRSQSSRGVSPVLILYTLRSVVGANGITRIPLCTKRRGMVHTPCVFILCVLVCTHRRSIKAVRGR